MFLGGATSQGSHGSTRTTTSSSTLTHATRKAFETTVPVQGREGQSLTVFVLVLKLRLPQSGDVVPYETPFVDISFDQSEPSMIPAKQLRSMLDLS